MDNRAKSYGTLRMKHLPKAEYHLMQALITTYKLDDASELFTISLRLMYEVLARSDVEGQAWLTSIIDHYRSYPEEVREYVLPEK